MGKWIKTAELRDIEELHAKDKISYSKVVQMLNDIVEDKLYGYVDNSPYTKHFLEWRDKFFERDTKILYWVSAGKVSRYTTDELHKNYTRAIREQSLE